MNQLAVKNKHKIDYFIAGPGKKADITASAKIIQEMHNNHTDIFYEMVASKACFCCRLKKVWIHIKPLPGVWHMQLRTIQERIKSNDNELYTIRIPPNH